MGNHLKHNDQRIETEQNRNIETMAKYGQKKNRTIVRNNNGKSRPHMNKESNQIEHNRKSQKTNRTDTQLKKMINNRQNNYRIRTRNIRETQQNQHRKEKNGTHGKQQMETHRNTIGKQMEIHKDTK